MTAETTGTYTPTDRTTPTRLRERVSYDREAVHAVLDEAVLCHVAFVADGLPVVLPQLHVRVGESLYLHGSTGARAMRGSRDDGLDVCVTVTLLDGLVLARSAFHHSANYRCVVAHGRAHLVTDPAEKDEALRHLVDAIVPGRSDHVRGPDRRELAATALLRLDLEEVSYKHRAGPPGDDAEDLDLPWWAGVLPVRGAVPDAPVPAPDLAPGIAVPDHVRGWRRG
ncbi:pyridoxamine 5'-phosphate oxidase family protein [Microlunatus flavus]|uniref:Nitroimidazol reductase NimA, pyridoxamine 5'-phosphate oxidase superfamily n=1 Tax=Microlunatus flavus TaxID=1036181 RepID=A0A1H9H6K3_9ACTN|nr:pyridoxamine 5'-phosphate oxidase family protein [Microlunatus flavus]SEQ57913.1 Nitroimidazol reductase NimA, pyridoxamine 5'-phosphate oxidase superfamily [Microlunatus flavus]